MLLVERLIRHPVDGRVFLALRRTGYFGEAKIKNLGVSALGDKNIRRLDIAVHDAFGMGGIKRVRNLDTERQELVGLERPTGDEVLQRLAVEEFHSDKSAAFMLADIVDGADVGVVQS